MTERDLTFNTPPPEDETSSAFANSQENTDSNPFVDVTDTDNDVSQYGRPFHLYSNDNSRNGTMSNLLSHSTDDFNNSSSFNRSQTPGSPDIQTPSYDRYASKNGSSYSLMLNNSVDNLGSNSYGDLLNLGKSYRASHSPNLRSDDESSFISEKTSSPFVQQSTDFSPFGGYPTTSFPLHIHEKEPDDYLHNPDPVADAAYDKNRFMHDLKNMDSRSMGGLFGFIFLVLVVVFLFIIYPVLTYSGVTDYHRPESYEVLTHYSYPLLSAVRTSLIDPDTPTDVYYKENSTGDKWKLTFSDEFNVVGRTFYDGDDQFFQAPDIHYDATKDLEWYDPDAVTTANGSLVLKMDAYENHDLFYRSGMVQSWNKLCFTQGMIMISARLPNYGNVSGLWPGLWTMGNLGRPGYMGTTEGVWPYTYDSCDAGITPNQSSPDGISYLPGQRLNACTCKGEDHPNRGTGRGAPEIDIIEGEVDSNIKAGVASQSYQIAPFDIWYYPDYNFVEIHNSDITTMNTYTGGPFQQAVSGTTTLNTEWYERGNNAGNFQVYGYEFLNDNDNGYLTWYVGVPTLTLHSQALGPNGNVGARRFPKEPMSIIMNLGISNNWAYIDWPSINFPVHMMVDYVRIYQPEDAISMTCDPEDHPTTDYIQQHLNIYSDPNITTFEDGGYTFPKNLLVHGCK